MTGTATIQSRLLAEPVPLHSAHHSFKYLTRTNMFDFQKLDVYQKSRNLNKAIFAFLKNNSSFSRSLKDQLTRATLSIPPNIAEGSSRFSKKEKRHYYIIARSSAMECVACLDAFLDIGEIQQESHCNFLNQYESLTRMLFERIISCPQIKSVSF